MNRSRAPRQGQRILEAAIVLAMAIWPAALCAQVAPKSAPHDGYWNCFASFFDGDFREASQSFREAAKNGVVNLSATSPGPWIDAICYHAMIGECHYQMGNLADALDEYTAALKFFLAHRDWMLRVDFQQANLEPELNPKFTVTWGKTSRATTLGHYQPRYPSFAGRLDNPNVLRTGGV